MRLLMGYSWGTAFASYVLLVGYVSRDVRRRRMPAGLWMLIVVVMPGGIGAVVYFLLRQPMMTPCPHCSTEITSSVHFCPQCQFQLAPVCGRCFRGCRSPMCTARSAGTILPKTRPRRGCAYIVTSCVTDCAHHR